MANSPTVHVSQHICPPWVGIKCGYSTCPAQQILLLTLRVGMPPPPPPPPPCEEPKCQVCSFISHMEDIVVHSITMEDFTSGRARLPFTSRGVWKATQTECPDLRRVHSHLIQGTWPSKKVTNIKDVKRYLQQFTIENMMGCLLLSKMTLLPPHVSVL